MGVANSKKLIQLASESKEQEAITLLNNVYLIDPNYTNSDGDSALHLSASNNLIQLTHKLLSFNVDLNKKNKFSACPLHIATRMGHLQIVRLLLKSKCNLNIESSPISPYNALTIAASCNNLSIARLLLEHNAHIQDITLLFASLHSSGDEMCRILLNHGANVNATDRYGNTALMQSAAMCHLKVVNVLVSREWSPIIQINKQNMYGWSALHYAYSAVINHEINSKNQTEISKHNIINLLLKKGANMNLRNNDMRKPKEVSPEKFENINFGLEQPRKKRRKLNEDRINKNLSKQFDIEARDKSDERVNESKENSELSEFDRESEDPYDNYSPPKSRDNRKRGRKKVVSNGVAPVRRSNRKRKK